jgi:polyhydroxybutyrate depolymerase
VVLNFHGFTSDSSQQILLTNMNAKADAEGFIAVHPDGTGVVKSFNAGLCCGEALDNNTDDVGFVRDMLDNLASDLCVDPQRIFATGMSNGGFLSHRLACELADRIAAVAPVAGVMGLPSCTPVRPVPIMHFHGTADPLVPYMGGQPLDLPEFGGVLPTFPSVPDTFEGWRQRNGCPDPAQQPAAITYQNGDVTCQTYQDCQGDAETTLCTVDGGGHTWPGGFPIEAVAIYLGHTTMDIVATDAMWTFFQRHPLP